MNLFRYLRLIFLVMIMSVMSGEISARWQQIVQISCTRAFLLTSDGVMLAADKIPGNKGGIYYSEDDGRKWTKADVPDHHYTQFHEVGDAIFALGEGGYIARSTDGGRQWEELFYCEDYLDDIPWGDVGSCDCYGLAVDGDRIYIANFAYLGVMYSDDRGDTWQLTTTEGMQIEEEGVTVADYLYNIAVSDGKLLAFGLNTVYLYDNEADRWETAYEDSNFLTILTNYRGQLVAGRGVPNDSFEANFLEKTTDGLNWEGVGRPKGFVHNNIRSLAADSTILAAGTANNGIFVTVNFGESWEDITSGMPLYDGRPGVYLWPVAMQIDDDYIYAAFYHPSEYDRKDSGIWRYPKASLAGIDAADAGARLSLSVSGRTLKVVGAEGCGAALELFTPCGVKVFGSDEGETDASSLAAGIYLYRLTSAGETVTGKLDLR